MSGFFLLLLSTIAAQSVTTVYIDLSKTTDTTVEIPASRSGQACGAANNQDCIQFVITLNPRTDQISLDNSQHPASAVYYINCDNGHPLSQATCITGLTTATITFCKPGTNQTTYTISAYSMVKGSADLNLRQGCSGTMSVSGLTASGTTWTSIYPGAAGTYDSYLSCRSGCTTTTVTPSSGSPAYIDYKVSGQTTVCGTNRSDTIRVYTSPPLTVAITPDNPAICSGAGTTLTATVSGGLTPYTYSWNTGASTAAISTAAVGTYTVTVSDNITACPAVTKSTSVTAAPTPAAPTAPGTTICAGSSATLAATAPGGTYYWYDASGNALFTGPTFTTPVLTTNTDYYVETKASGCTSSRTRVTVTVNPIPAAPVTAGATICAGNTASISASSPGGTYNWFAASAGGSSLGSGNSFITPVLAVTTTYYVQSTINGCTGNRSAVTVTVNPIPAAPTASSATICSGTSASLQATAPGGSYQWFNQASGGTVLSNSENYNTPLLTANATYYVQSTISGCTGNRTAVTVTITNNPAAPTVSDASICTGTTATLTATAPGGPYEWYDAQTGGTKIATGASFTTPSIASATSYYVQSGVAGCLSSRSKVNVVVNTIPPAPMASANPICAGGTATLSAGSSIGTYQWYDISSGGTLLFSGASVTTGPLTASTSYYVQSNNNGCAGPRTTVNVLVNSVPAAPLATANTICAGTSATLTATSPGGFYEWFSSAAGGTALNTGTNFVSPPLSANTVYYVQTTVNGCTSNRSAITVTVNPSPSAPSANGVTICADTKTTLTATAPGGAYRWYNALTGGNLLVAGASYTTPVLTVTADFYVETEVSGCTSNRTKVTVTITPLPPVPTVSANAICAGNAATLNASSSTGDYQWFDAPTDGHFLYAGANYVTGALSGDVTYYVQSFANGCASPRAAATVTVNAIPAAPTVAAVSTCFNKSATLTASAPGGTYDWFSNAIGGTALSTGTSFETPALSSNTTYYIQSTINGCTGSRTPVTVTVQSIPAAPAVGGATLCAGLSATLAATAPGGTYKWYDAATGGNLLTVGNVYATAPLNSTTNFYVETEVAGCTGPRSMATVTINPVPATPSAAAGNACEGTTVTLTATAPGGIYQWYDAPTGGTVLGGGASYTSGILNVNTNFYVSSTISGCTGSRAAVPVTVTPLPGLPTVADANICSGNNATLMAMAPGGNYQWFDAASGGTLLSSGASYLTPALNSSVTYYVQTSVGGCTGNRTAVTVTVNPTPPAPTVLGNTICAGNATNFTATAPGGIYQWYDAATGGALIFSGPTFTTPALNSSTHYFVQVASSGCISARTLVTATVNAIPPAPTVAATTICADNSALLTASAPGGNYEWYDAATGGNLLNSGNNFTTPSLSSNTSYFVQTTVSGCTGPRNTVTVTVIPKLNPSFQYSSGTFCISGANPTPAIAGNLSGTFSASPAGLVFTNTTTGQINVAASLPGTYTIVFVTGGSCVYSKSAKVTITGTPDATFDYGGPLCQQQVNASPNFRPGASAGIFSASPAGLVFSNNSTGEIDLQKTAPGNYTVTNAIAASAGCVATNAVSTVIVNPAAVANAGVDQTICSGVVVQLSGSIGGSAGRATWSGGRGSIANPSSLSTTYIPAAGETAVKLFLTTNDPEGPCGAATNSLTILIITTPEKVTVTEPTVCTGSAATLIATAPGGIYEWYDAPAGGNLLASANSIVTPALNSTTLYYVRSVINGCAGNRSPVTVHVVSRPVVTSKAAAILCSGALMKYIASGNQPGTIFNWSRNSVSGISNAPASGITDSIITEVLLNTSGVPAKATYQLIPSNGNCVGEPFAYVVTVNPTPAMPVVTANSPVCVGSTLNLSTPAVESASYSWTGPNNFFSGQQNPVLPNIILSSAGVYAVTVTVNGCTSTAGTKNIFPVITAPAASSNAPVCSGNKLLLSAGNLTAATYQWSGPGGFSSSSQNPVINAASAANAGIYYLTASIAGCPGLTDSVHVLVNVPPATPQVNSNSPVCSREAVLLNASGSGGASYLWTGPNDFTSTDPHPVIKNATEQHSGTYTVIASTAGCTKTAVASVPVSVTTTPAAPAAGSNSPICVGNALNLFAAAVPGAGYKWSTVSGGFNSYIQNPVINNVSAADALTYLVVASLNGCVGDTTFVNVSVVTPAVASAGRDQLVCANNATVQLNGSITGQDTKTGIWKTNGTGRFMPGDTLLNSFYLPSSADTARGAVTLTLSTTNNRYCAASASSVVVTISDAPFAEAGPDKTVCSNDSLVALKGLVANAGGGQWYSIGSGRFMRSGTNDLQPVYVPSAQDIRNGAVQLYLTSTNNGNCVAASDTIMAAIIKAPKVDAGIDRTLFLNDRFIFAPVVTGTSLSYKWTPGIDLVNDGTKNAVLIARNSTNFRLTVMGDSSCSAYDEVFIKVLKPISIPNIFSPNGDGIHDTWEIPELNNYAGATVEIFTRGGMKIYSSVGYERPWDGTFNGNPVPVATYYYIINPNYNGQRFSGSITVIR